MQSPYRVQQKSSFTSPLVSFSLSRYHFHFLSFFCVFVLSLSLFCVIKSKDLGENVHASVGISTGRVFCGVVGSPNRREYTLMGDSVNLAARLMSEAGKDGVLVDEPTAQACLASKSKYDYEFEALAPLRLKGKKQPVQTFRPRLTVGIDSDATRPPSHRVSTVCALLRLSALQRPLSFLLSILFLASSLSALLPRS